jgi:hypothetical protein
MSEQGPSPTTEHPGWDALLRHHQGDLPAAQAEKVTAHAAECALCASRLHTLSEGARKFQGERPFAVLESALRNRRDGLGGSESLARPSSAPRWLLPVVLGGFAAAAGAFVILRMPLGSTASTPAESPRERLKSGVGLSFDVERGGQVVPGDPGAIYKAGDRIQLKYSAPAPLNVVVVSLDGRGDVTVFHDDAGTGLRVEAGTARSLPTSIVLDDAPGAERIVACFSDSALTSAAVVAAGRRALAAAEGDPRTVGALDLPCAQAELLLHKE